MLKDLPCFAWKKLDEADFFLTYMGKWRFIYVSNFKYMLGKIAMEDKKLDDKKLEE